MCLLSHRKSFISNNPIFAQLRAYLLVFACLFAYQSLFSHSCQMFVQLCALSRKAMRINAHATILINIKGRNTKALKDRTGCITSPLWGHQASKDRPKLPAHRDCPPTTGHLSLSPMSIRTSPKISRLSLSPMSGDRKRPGCRGASEPLLAT